MLSDNSGCGKATRKEIANSALKHYEELATKACHWTNTIEHALKFWADNEDMESSITELESRLAVMDKVIAAHDKVINAQVKELNDIHKTMKALKAENIALKAAAREVVECRKRYDESEWDAKRIAEGNLGLSLDLLASLLGDFKGVCVELKADCDMGAVFLERLDESGEGIGLYPDEIQKLNPAKGKQFYVVIAEKEERWNTSR